ncbi:DUF1343 domain-containing protein [uncultured Lacinutrix sp.]|uniref:exo-beta-N-acetylmuramidase NamZ family protein n=1 Tax=uncultured Lacinutrix sp. TaxID=574032 RepID=UPI0026137942|nr:DUF1343 domain-containing protein [uncultured Lacinutrix sp.]
MRLTFVKNTVLLFLFLGFSCANNKKPKSNSNNAVSNHNSNTQTKEVIDNKTDSIKPIIIGANQTETYIKLLEGKRVGIVANQTSVIFKDKSEKIKVKSFTHIVDSLLLLNVNIKKVFSPEHGFRGNVDAGELVKDGLDTKTGLPITSLYGKNKKPSLTQLKDLDIVVFDIQDVGVRFYTYISTLHHVMEACAENNISVIVLDRPNPNGHYIDGPTMEPKHTSFLGMHTIPLVHGLTIGEYATMINGESWLANNVKCDLTIIKMKHYTHDKPYSLPLRPSPNLPNDQSIKLYPSLGLFEGTTINAGRGTEFQFQRYGAPFLDSTALSFTYTPKENFGAKFPKHKNKLCYGEDLSNVKTKDGVTLKYIIKAYKNSKNKETFFKTASFTKHAGTQKLQDQIEKGLTEKEIKATWKNGLDSFSIIRNKYLLYN